MSDDIQPTQDANPEDEPARQPVEVSMERVEKLLAEGNICEDHGRMRWSSNYTALITVEDDELQTMAVYKPQRGERPLWDFPDGTLCYREVAAYAVSQALEWDVVAPTVLREGSIGIGSVQLFVEHDPRITYFQLTDDFVPQLQRVATFDYLVNNTDRKGGHLLLDAQGKLWGIDHGICFHPHPKLRTVIWDFAGDEMAEDIIADVQMLCGKLETRDSDLNDRLKNLLSKVEVDALRGRVDTVLKTRRYPKPGPGPNYPWPAV
ncbi:MAG: SCO1664 family protein [Chloroflexi bacterium]|nr:SCO1664 family protein [Chloroflexota bacterium]